MSVGLVGCCLRGGVSFIGGGDTSEVMLYPFSGHMMSFYPITSDVVFDRVDNAMFADLGYHKVTFFFSLK